MRHIHLTDEARVQYLNCVKGKAYTDSALEEADKSTDILLLLLQEPCTNGNGQPPFALHCDHFCSTGNKTKSVTYIRKNLNLNPRNITPLNHSIKKAITINHKSVNIYNVYLLGVTNT